MFSVRPGRISLDDVFDDGRAWARRDSRHMSIRKSFVRIFALALVCALCIACVGCDGSKNNSTVKPTLDDSNVKEWWAFDYDEETPALIIRKDGTASYKGVEYAGYEITDNMYKLTDASGAVLELEFSDKGGKRQLYDIWEYKRTYGTSGPSVVGVWESGNNYFEFTVNQTFQEDGMFFGHYSVDVNAGTVKLMYERDLDDTVFYYHIENDVMTVRYPFLVVPYTQ